MKKGLFILKSTFFFLFASPTTVTRDSTVPEGFKKKPILGFS